MGHPAVMEHGPLLGQRLPRRQPLLQFLRVVLALRPHAIEYVVKHSAPPASIIQSGCEPHMGERAYWGTPPNPWQGLCPCTPFAGGKERVGGHPRRPLVMGTRRQGDPCTPDCRWNLAHRLMCFTERTQ